ncbi:MAG: hypothetical protein J1E63_00400, partial [Muribaculaceae bacterium]|nr:hypothetical protein [Muribaculaceae bacterium]
MKKLNFFLPVYFAILAVVLGLSSCNDAPENPAAEPEEPAVVPEAAVNPLTIEFDADATEAQMITISANTT